MVCGLSGGGLRCGLQWSAVFRPTVQWRWWWQGLIRCPVHRHGGRWVWTVMSLWIVEAGLVDEHAVVRPREARNEDLLLVHSKSYLENLKVCMFAIAPDLMVGYKCVCYIIIIAWFPQTVDRCWCIFCHVKTQATTHSLGTLIFTFSVTLSSI